MMIVYISLIVLILLLTGLWLVMERRLWPHQSTLVFWHLSNLPLLKKLEGYFYAARAEWYLKPVNWSWFMRRFVKYETADTYHGKMLTRDDASRLIRVNQPINLTELEHVIPYPVARNIILNHPLPSLAVLECPCRAQKKEACLPRDVCLIVGEPYVSFVVDHQPERARKISVEEALEIIDDEEKRGHIHTAWFKDVMHNRFYTICNCCSCCCLGMKSYQRGVPRLAHSGYSPALTPELCSGCGICISLCPFQAILMDDDYPVIDYNICMGCGLCVSHCPCAALELTVAPHRGTPLDIEQLANKHGEI